MKGNNARKGTREVHVGFINRASAIRFAKAARRSSGRVRTYVYRSGFEYCVNVVRW